MDNEIICVYQDCPLCGDKGKKLKKLIFEKGLNVRKVSFASEEGKKLCHQAIFKHEIKTMPFFTDGKRFATNLDDLIKKPTKKTRKRGKKVIKIMEGGTDGSDS